MRPSRAWNGNFCGTTWGRWQKKIAGRRAPPRRMGHFGDKVDAYLSEPNWKSGFRPLIGCGWTFTSGEYTVTADPFGLMEACASAGTLINEGGISRVRSLAVAGDASKAATPAADSTIFQFNVMFFNLMFSSRCPGRELALILQCTRRFIITTAVRESIAFIWV